MPKSRLLLLFIFCLFFSCQFGSNKNQETNQEASKEVTKIEEEQPKSKPKAKSADSPKSVSSPKSSSQVSIDQSLGEQMVQAVNVLRRKGCKCGNKRMPAVAPLRWNPRLAEAAQVHAIDMQKNEFFSHTGSNGSKIKNRINDTGYTWSRIGENIAWGQRSLDEVMEGWIDSKGHCLNMMNADFSELGAAREDNYWVQTFGRPR